MSFFDLNVPHPSNPPSAAETANLSRVVDQLCTLGFQVCAFNTTVTTKLPQNHVSPIKFLDAFRETAPPNDPPAPPSTTTQPSHPAPPDAGSHRGDLLRAKSSVHRSDLIPYTSDKSAKRIRQLSRITLVADDPGASYSFHNSPHLNAYDLIAVQPTSERMLQHVCSSWNIDIISFDLSSRLPFHLKPTTIGLAADRGIFFELALGPAVRDSGARKWLVSNAAQVVKACGGRNLIISGGWTRAIEVRGGHDLANLATLFGLSPSTARAALTTTCRALVARAESRRVTHRAAVAVSPTLVARPTLAQAPDRQKSARESASTSTAPGANGSPKPFTATSVSLPDEGKSDTNSKGQMKKRKGEDPEGGKSKKVKAGAKGM
ncbi:PHP domain-like protein [Gonapodya prolifera JEL478]|uniref:PHP domain-like protein n=1 Tax=Gonapodya prolifera (strain JEL478) TaxID=1344416 RepID=A0A139AZH0_GONPJ|nr:PHP domain-like protein [Gonapodya prolifera JEL478]|eukprot:KXS22132.1 PHP domain-like protein [Gonapodya prolifera JEL478]